MSVFVPSCFTLYLRTETVFSCFGFVWALDFLSSGWYRSILGESSFLTNAFAKLNYRFSRFCLGVSTSLKISCIWLNWVCWPTYSFAMVSKLIFALWYSIFSCFILFRISLFLDLNNIALSFSSTALSLKTLELRALIALSRSGVSGLIARSRFISNNSLSLRPLGVNDTLTSSFRSYRSLTRLFLSPLSFYSSPLITWHANWESIKYFSKLSDYSPMFFVSIDWVLMTCSASFFSSY